MDEADLFYLNGTNDNVMLAERFTGVEGIAGIDETEAYGYIKDIRGSSMTLLNDEGETAVNYQYTDYGETIINETELVKNDLMYTGAVYDKYVENYYMNARYYNPDDASFLTQDTFRGTQEDMSTWNLYAYCAGDPINNTDPTGHSTKSIIRDEIKAMTTLKGFGLKSILNQILKNRTKWCTNRSVSSVRSLKAPELLARMIYGECTPEVGDNVWEDRYEAVAFWKIVKNSSGSTKRGAIKKELLTPTRYSGLTHIKGNGLVPSYNIKWARAVIIGTMYQKKKMGKLMKATGITKNMRYWHSEDNWGDWYNKSNNTVLFPSTGKRKKVICVQQYASTFFYGIKE
jgi:RHS repeat-associated protein